MTYYRVYTKEYFDENLPWSLKDDGYLCRCSAEDADHACCELSGYEPMVLMRESAEHLDYIIYAEAYQRIG